jgi:hypothetical protein
VEVVDRHVQSRPAALQVRNIDKRCGSSMATVLLRRVSLDFVSHELSNQRRGCSLHPRNHMCVLLQRERW